MDEDGGLCQEGGELLLKMGGVSSFFVSYCKKKEKKKEKRLDPYVTL